MRVFYAGIILFAAVMLVAVEAKAVPAGSLEASGISISPAVIEVTAKQGETVETEVMLRNVSGEEQVVEMRVKDFEKHGDQIVFLEEPVDPKFSVAAWAEVIPRGPIRLLPKKWVTARVIVRVPRDAEVGEHVAAVNVRTVQPKKQIQGTGMGVLTSLSVAFYVKVTDLQGKMNVVKDWKLNWVKGARWNGGRYVLSLTNTGNVHLVSEGKLKIHDWLNNQTVEEPLLYTNFLPGVTKELAVEWKNPKRLGYFQAEIEVTLDGGERYERYRTWFVRVPNAVVLAMVLTFVLVFLSIQLYVRRVKKRMLEGLEQVQSKE